MENALDKIAKGQVSWVELCKSCNNEIDALVEKIKEETKIEYKIDENNTYLIGKYGPVIKCVEETDDGKETITFKPVRKDMDCCSRRQAAARWQARLGWRHLGGFQNKAR